MNESIFFKGRRRPIRADFFLGSARATRAGDRALAIANFFSF
jgi:hypothetical protein